MRPAGRGTLVLALGIVVLAGGCARVRGFLRPPVNAAIPTQVAFVDQFDSLWTRFDDVYPSFEYKQVDWQAARERYRPRALRARTQDELIAVLLDMLAPLRDRHIWLVDPRGQVVPSYRATSFVNFDRGRWQSALRDANYFARPGNIGDGTLGGFGYLFIGSWRAPVDADVLDAMLARAQNAQGLIIDVRTNAGGNDQTALSFASRFTIRTVPASLVQIRIDPRVTGVQFPLPRNISPRGAWQYTRPVVIIAGRGGLSATESFVAAMRTLPQVTVIGDTTGGASGNPATFSLGNGWQFTVPRWLEYGPDRNPIEWRGVAPHLPIAWQPASYERGRDPLIDAAVGLLGERTGVYRMAPAQGADSAGRGGRDPKTIR